MPSPEDVAEAVVGKSMFLKSLYFLHFLSVCFLSGTHTRTHSPTHTKTKNQNQQETNQQQKQKVT